YGAAGRDADGAAGRDADGAAGRDAPDAGGMRDPEAPGAVLDVPELLGALVDKSLVVAAPGGDDGMRYRMLETIHEYASERAGEEPAELAAAERAHRAYFTGFAEHADPLLRSAGQLPWIRRVETELDNIEAVLDRTVAAGDEQATQRMLFAVCWFWWLRDYRTESLRRIEQALALGPEPAGEDDPRFWPYRSLQLLRVFLLSESGGLESLSDGAVAGNAGGGNAATPREIISTFDRPGPHSARFPGMLWGLLAFFLDHDADPRRMMDDAMANVRRYGGAWETAVLLMGRAHVLIDQPDGIQEADACLVELSELSSRIGDRWVLAQVAGAAAEAAMARGQFEKARAAYEESLRYAREVGAHAEPPFLLVRLAELSFRAGDEDAAERGLAEAVRAVERTHAQDTEAFIGLLRAMLAIGRQDVAEARAAIDASKEAARRGTLPPQFETAAATVEARIASYEEEGPHAAARSLGRVLKDALAGRFAPVVLAQAAEAAALILLRAGEPARAVRALSAAEAWRGDFPRSVPEQREATGAEAAARGALGPAAYEAARAAGASLTPAQVADDLASLPDPPPNGADAPAEGDDPPPADAGPDAERPEPRR
ncbi:AfsR/SARP family transcriptional regulator, partial [Streptomyces sp. 8L]|nr:AfsR/SARP family transcriptional regulator [Streptomyces sp. 8L]